MTRIGDLDQLVTLERATTVPNAFNEPVESWATLAEVWADRRDASAGETYRAAEVGAEITTRFRIRWSSDVADLTPKDRLRLGDRIYAITAVREIGRRAWLELDAVARAETTP